jgi:predicted acylesterase/phospholipase RssA
MVPALWSIVVSATRHPRVGLALSGGGFRATAFGLGALRALHDRNVLADVEVVSGVSGGSLLTAMWAYGPGDFEEFDDTVTSLLRRGLQRELARRALHPRRAYANTASVAGAMLPGRRKRNRTSTRTEALVDALMSRNFGTKKMAEVTHEGLSTIISATDLSTGNAVRFGSRISSCSPHGFISEPVLAADAVAASAAFPALLPQLQRTYTFNRLDGSQHRKAMQMIDGGVYDNLGLSPLLPGRSKKYTNHAYDLEYVIAIDAGIGRTSVRAPNFWPGRMKRSFEIAHTRAQDGSRARVHELAQAGALRGFVYSYLGMSDSRLPVALPDLVERETVAGYPTNFAPVAAEDLEALTLRGEQLTRHLVDYYCPPLGT